MIKEFTYRGVARQFSNRYHFSGGTPADSSHWTTFSDAVVTAEKAIFNAESADGAKIIATVGYEAGSEIPVFNKTYATDGTLGQGSALGNPGDVAFLVRYSTNARSSKNHPIYLFNYYHACLAQGSQAFNDQMNGPQRTAAQTYASSWISGFSDGTHTLKRSGPNGDDATGSLVELLVTHRDLPR